MCGKSWKIVLRGDNHMYGNENSASFMTSDILPDEPELNCRVTQFMIEEASNDVYTSQFIEVRGSFHQPGSLDTVQSQQDANGIGIGGINGSTSLCFVPTTPTAGQVSYLANPTEKFVVSKPTNQIWEISLYNDNGTPLLTTGGAQPKSWVLVLEFTKITED